MSEYILPYNGKIKLTSPFGLRVLNGVHEFHYGIDLVGMESKAILSPCDGIVKSSTIILNKNDITWEWGNYIRIDKDDISIYLCHLSERLVINGQKVLQGQPIGYEGDTGYCFGNHLHLEFRKQNISFNPCELLSISNKIDEYKNKPDAIYGHDWSYNEIAWAVKNGLIKGYSADKIDYQLDKNLTREELLVILYRFYEYLN